MVAVYIFAFFLVLAIGFVGMTMYERREGRRFFESYRASLDETVARARTYMRRVHVHEALEHSVRQVVFYISHAVLAFLHIVTRELERLLRRARRKVQRARPQQEASSYVKTMHEFKNGLGREE